MKRTIRVSIFLLVCLWRVLPVAAAGNEGTEDIFNFGTGARALGMGRTFVGIADDPGALYWNPAGLAIVDRKALSFFYAKLFEDTLYGSLFYAHPTLDYGTIGIGALTLHTGGIPAYDENSYYSSDFSETRIKLILGYAYTLPWLPLSLGVSLKMHLTSVGETSGNSVNMDFGLHYDFLGSLVSSDAAVRAGNALTAGMAVRNLFIGSGERLFLEEDEERLEVKLGASWLNHFLPELALRLAVDAHFYQERSFQFSFGVESVIYRDYFLRAGYITDSGLTLGGGLRISEWGLDYALVMRPLGATHNITLSFAFGTPRSEELRERERQRRLEIELSVSNATAEQKLHYEEEMRRIGEEYTNEMGRRAGQFDSTLKEREQAYQSEIARRDTNYRAELGKRDRALEELERQRAREREEAEKRLVDLEKRTSEELADYRRRLDETISRNEREINELKERRDREVADLRREMAERAQKLESEFQTKIATMDSDFQRRLQTINQTNTEARTRLREQFEADKRRLREDENRKSQEYAKGVELYGRGDFEKALESFQRVQAIDPAYADVQTYVRRILAQRQDVSTYSEQIMTYYRRGVALFLQEKYEEAIAVWQEILRIDPYNKLALRNIDNARKRLDAMRRFRR